MKKELCFELKKELRLIRTFGLRCLACPVRRLAELAAIFIGDAYAIANAPCVSNFGYILIEYPSCFVK